MSRLHQNSRSRSRWMTGKLSPFRAGKASRPRDEENEAEHCGFAHLESIVDHPLHKF